MSDLLVFTANADELLIVSGNRVGIDVQSYSPLNWGGYVNGKLRCGIEFLESRTEPYAMWVDGYDSLILKSAEEILYRFRDMYADTEICISAERNCWPDANLADQFLTYESLPSFPCAGGYIGQREQLIRTMKIVLEHAKDDDDQRAWTATILDRKAKYLIEIDYLRRLWCSMADNDADPSDTCVSHWNGRVGGRDEYWRKLNA